MKKFEKVFGMLTVISLILRFASLPGGSVLLTLSLSALACVYYFYAFTLFDQIEIKSIFNSKSREGISAMIVFESKLAGWGLAVVCIGILFKIMQFPGEAVMLSVGLIIIFAVGIIALIKYNRSKTDFYKMILIRIAIIGGFGLLLFFHNIFKIS